MIKLICASSGCYIPQNKIKMKCLKRTNGEFTVILDENNFHDMNDCTLDLFELTL